jgi:hypothetical protein
MREFLKDWARVAMWITFLLADLVLVLWVGSWVTSWASHQPRPVQTVLMAVMGIALVSFFVTLIIHSDVGDNDTGIY